MEDDMANIIVAQLLYLDAIDPNKVKMMNKTLSDIQFLFPIPIAAKALLRTAYSKNTEAMKGVVLTVFTILHELYGVLF